MELNFSFTVKLTEQLKPQIELVSYNGIFEWNYKIKGTYNKDKKIKEYKIGMETTTPILFWDNSILSGVDHTFQGEELTKTV